MVSRAAKSPLLSIVIDRDGPGSLQEQIFDAVRDAILNGRLAPGTRLPASRVLASELGVSRNTILAAFERLYAEGYTEGQIGSGTQVSRILPEELLSARARSGGPSSSTNTTGKVSQLSRQMVGLGDRHSVRGSRAFRPGLPDLETFPYQLWSRLIARFWRHPPRDLLVSGDLSGYRPLRDSVAAYLGAVRGVRCSGEQIIITSGAQQALDLIARTIIDPGDDVWVEDPGYSGLRNTLMAAGAMINHIPVDQDGISVRAGRKVASEAVLAAVTPSHQYPLGITMSLSRRLELLDWAADSGAWILEDDYDSEYRYAGKPYSALQGLDEQSRVIYVGTFSKVLFPALRLGYVVVPDALIDPFLRVRAALDDQPALALQPALNRFIDDGYFASHIRRLRGLYAERQELLLSALAYEGQGALSASPHEAGMHLVAGLTPQLKMSDVSASDKAAEVGLIAPALSRSYKGAGTKQGLLLGYAGLTEPEIKRSVQKLAQVLVN